MPNSKDDVKAKDEAKSTDKHKKAVGADPQGVDAHLLKEDVPTGEEKGTEHVEDQARIARGAATMPRAERDKDAEPLDGEQQPEDAVKVAEREAKEDERRRRDATLHAPVIPPLGRP